MIPTTRIIPTQIPALNISPISSQPVRPTATTESIKINGQNEIFFITSIFLSLIDSYIEVRCKIVPVDLAELQLVGWSGDVTFNVSARFFWWGIIGVVHGSVLAVSRLPEKVDTRALRSRQVMCIFGNVKMCK